MTVRELIELLNTLSDEQKDLPVTFYDLNEQQSIGSDAIEPIVSVEETSGWGLHARRQIDINIS